MTHSISFTASAEQLALLDTKPKPSHGRLAPLDGLRGIAVLLVLLFHWKYLPFGWAGVWLFFTLSGFFIFRNLLAVRRANPGIPFSSYFSGFMYRRCLRLFPLYYLLLIIMTVTVIVLQRWDMLAWTVPGLALFIHNLMKPFSTIQHTLYYDHFWTLGVEMHFYLIAPFLAYFLSRSRLKALLIAVVLITPFLRQGAQVLLGNDPSWLTIKPGGFIYVISFFHFDAFALGGLAAMHERPVLELGKKAWWLLIVPAALFLAYSAFIVLVYRDVPYQLFMYDHLQASLGYTLLIGSCSGLLCVALVDQAFLHRLLTLPPLLLLGRISYGVYLIHGALLMATFALWETYLPGTGRFSPVILAVFCLYMLVTVGLAWLSFTFFESRFLPSQRVEQRGT